MCRGLHVLCAVAGLLYVVGGMSELGVELRTVEAYNPVTQEWRQLARMATPRAYVGVAVLDDYIYAVGGWNEARRALRTAERYSIEQVRDTFRPLRTNCDVQ